MSRDLQWLVAANAIFVVGGLIAYATSINLALITAFALVAALGGLWHMREGPLAAGADVGRSFAAGGWAVLAILIILPYITVLDGRSLWSSDAYAALTVAAAGAAMAGWNAALLRNHPQMRTYLGFHALMIVAAFILALRGDGTSIIVEFGGDMIAVRDLRLAPALVAAPSLSWALAVRAQDST
ncbi:MAG: hypothetical protein ACPHID_07155 [Thermoplasmatota archaeon]